MSNLFGFLSTNHWLNPIYVLAVVATLLMACDAVGQESSESGPSGSTQVIEEDSSSDSDNEETAAETVKEKSEREIKTDLMIKQVKEAFPGKENEGLVKDLSKVIKKQQSPAYIKNDAVVLGILMVILALIFWTSNIKSGFWGSFYKVVPMLLICYFLPSLLTLFGVVDKDSSGLYHVATRYLLPATLVLLTLSIDLKEIFGLGPKALIMFLTGTAGVVLGGPIAVFVVALIWPDIIGVDGPEAVWRGLSTVAGSWIGGGANQAAMQGIYMDWDNASPELEKHYRSMYSVMVAVDVIVAEVWMLFLLLGVDRSKDIDRLLKADASSIERLKDKMENFSLSVARIPSATDLMILGAIGFGGTAIAHYFGADIAQFFSQMVKDSNAAADEGSKGALAFLQDLGLASSFFWLIVISTTIGVLLSFTPMRKYEGAGASKLGTVFIFILVAVIGMQMDVKAFLEYPGFFLIGGIWMLFHVGLMVFMCWLIRAPYFFLAVGSKANIGGAASAPVVAAAFHPALAPVGVLLAVLGYALGTYGAIACAKLMQLATPIGG